MGRARRELTAACGGVREDGDGTATWGRPHLMAPPRPGRRTPDAHGTLSQRWWETEVSWVVYRSLTRYDVLVEEAWNALMMMMMMMRLELDIATTCDVQQLREQDSLTDSAYLQHQHHHHHHHQQQQQQQQQQSHY